MTYIHSEHRTISIFNLAIAGLIFTSFVGVFWLIALYNNIVDLNHSITASKAQLDSVGAQNTALNSQIASSLGSVNSDNIASADGLVQDNHPT